MLMLLLHVLTRRPIEPNRCVQRVRRGAAARMLSSPAVIESPSGQAKVIVTFLRSGDANVGVSLRSTAATGLVSVYGSGANARLAVISGSPMALAFWSQHKEVLRLGMATDNFGVVTVRDSKG